jgi:hypothetical protein
MRSARIIHLVHAVSTRAYLQTANTKVEHRTACLVTLLNPKFLWYWALHIAEIFLYGDFGGLFALT